MTCDLVCHQQSSGRMLKDLLTTNLSCSYHLSGKEAGKSLEDRLLFFKAYTRNGEESSSGVSVNIFLKENKRTLHAVNKG